jgi:ABC-type protease/lipase transport system fused ATPase/permease subunit
VARLDRWLPSCSVYLLRLFLSFVLLCMYFYYTYIQLTRLTYIPNLAERVRTSAWLKVRLYVYAANEESLIDVEINHGLRIVPWTPG